MAEVTLQKGNLFNPLTGYFDFNLLNSSEYDLEINIDGRKKYYRIRFKDFEYVVTQLKPNSTYEFIKPDHLGTSSKDEVLEFIKSEFYNNEFKAKGIVERNLRENRTKKYKTDASYSNFFATMFQKSKFNSIPLYSFYVDSKNWYNRKDVLGYKVTVENVRNRYYIVFVECIGKETSTSVDNQVLWFVYDRKEFLEEKECFEEKVLSLVSNNDYPLMLTESLILLSGANEELANNIIEQLKKYREYFRSSKVQKFLRRDFEMKDDISIKNSLIKILGLDNYQMIRFALENNNTFGTQLIDYITNDEDDIENAITDKKTLRKHLD